jgi:hypothetical protein
VADCDATVCTLCTVRCEHAVQGVGQVTFIRLEKSSLTVYPSMLDCEGEALAASGASRF